MSRCLDCGKEVTPLEANVTRKLVNRASTEFYCKSCIAKKFGITEKRVDELIEVWKSQDCVLFTSD